jgi:hypothetical protein
LINNWSPFMNDLPGSKPILAALLALGFSACLPSGLGQEKNEPPPAPPLVQPLPQNLRWTMSFTIRKELLAPKEPGRAPPLSTFPKEVRITKTGDIEEQAITWSDQSHSTAYFARGFRLHQDPSNGIVVVQTGAIDPEAVHAIPQPGWFGVEWIKPSSFQGTVNLGGLPCHHYLEKTSAPLPEADSPDAPFSKRIVREAWIDAKSRLPVKVVAHLGVVTFAIDPTPAAPVTLPPEFQKAWTDYQGQLTRLQRMRMP